MNPEVREVFLKRTKMIQSMRRTMESHGFIEVETPMMHPIAGGAVARPFVTHHNTLDMDLYLRIAPELYLKRLVVGGLDRVYEINRNFRNEGLGWRWNPEFTMLEAYQAYTDYQGIMNVTQEVITEAAKAVNGGTKAKWGDQEIDWANWQRLTMREAIIQYWPEAAGAKPQMSDFASHDSVKALVERFNKSHAHMAYNAADPAGKTVAALFETVAEEHLRSQRSSTNFRLRFLRCRSRNPMSRSGRSVSKFMPGRWRSPTASVNSMIRKTSASV